MTRVIVILIGLVLWARPAPAQDPTEIRFSEVASWEIDPLLFGRFFEHNGKDAYPGLYAQHLANGSFEPWFEDGRNRRREVIFDVQKQEGLTYPWRASAGSTHEGGPTGESYQRFQGKLVQRVAIPHERTLDYDVHLYARGASGRLAVRMLRPDGSVAAQSIVPLSGEWTRHTVQLILENASASSYRGSPFGVYDFVLEADSGADVDGAMLMSGDAVDGKYNPTTIELLRAFNVTTMRWPGGNWASAYHWRDGVGPLVERPVRPNLAWGGLEANYFGTNEFLEFCELAGMEPLINAAFNYDDIPPEDAAAWVEYVNGDTTTAMGRLRAEHGYPEPWNVRLWQIGNEVYGTYQYGHEPAEAFATKYREYYDAMKAVDSTITILASAPDPLYTDWDAEEWNDTFFRIAGEKIEGLDIHRYVRGETNRERLREWNEREYMLAFAAFPFQFEEILRILRRHASTYGIDDLSISIGEWNANPRRLGDWPEIDYPTMAHASFVAGMFNTFVRQGDAVRYSFQRDNTLYFRPYHTDMRPVNPGAYVLRAFSEVLGEGGWRALDVAVDGPTYSARPMGERQIPVDSVFYIDAAAAISPDGATRALFLTNRDLYSAKAVVIHLGDEDTSNSSSAAAAARLHSISAQDPFARQTSWEGPEAFSVAEEDLTVDGGVIRVTLSPAAVVRILISE